MNNITKDNEKNLDSLLAFLNGICEEKRKEFFYDNRENMDTLVWYYCDEFKNEVYKDQRAKIEKYRTLICDETETEEGRETEEGKWWIHTGRVLGIYWGEIGKHRIGIECVFKNENHDEKLGEFHIYVASWDQSNFGDYEQGLKDEYRDKPIDNKSAKNRAFLFVDKHKPEETKKIINTLSDTYNKLKDIIAKHKKLSK